jgi:hypothetical protein
MTKENKFLEQYPQLDEKDYLVTFYEVHYNVITVRAGNPELALEKAALVYSDTAVNIEVHFHHTMDTNTWHVEEIKNDE